MTEAVYWATAIASLVAVWLNIKKLPACFWIWACTNAVWCYADATHGLTSQAMLQAAYFFLSVHGIRTWGNRRREKNPL